MVSLRQTMMAEMIEMGIDPMAEIRALGYEFRNGILRQVSSNAGFTFKDGSNYESLADAIAQYVPLLLEEEAQLKPVWLPQGVNPGEGCPIFVSEGYQSAEKLFLIIQGAGRVRAGIWGCNLCINDSLEHGTMLPYLRMASALGYGVIVFNPNENHVEGKPIPGSENSSNHVAYVMEHIVPQCSAKGIDILAHSQGGRSLLNYLARAKGNNIAGSIVEKLERIVFTDSYHVQTQLAFLPSRVRTLLSDPKRAINFVPHGAPLGTRVEEWSSQEYSFTDAERGCLCVSSGVLDHASTNYVAIDAVFDFLQIDRHENVAQPGQLNVTQSASLEKHQVFSSEAALPVDYNESFRTIEASNGTERRPTRSNRHTSWTRLKNYMAGAMTRSKGNNTITPFSNNAIPIPLAERDAGSILKFDQKSQDIACY
jgi:hypothetical protein